MGDNKISHRENTAEKYYGCAAYLIGAVFVAVLIISAMSGLIVGDMWVVATCAAVWIAVWAPVLGYYIYQYLYYHRVDLTDIQKAELCGTDSGWLGDIGLRLCVSSGGARCEVTTRRVFGARGVTNNVDRYTHGEITVGYNAGRDEWIVLFKD